MTKPEKAKKAGSGVLWSGVVLLVVSIVGGIAGIVVGVVMIAGLEDQLTRITNPSGQNVELIAGEHSVYSGSRYGVPPISIIGPAGQQISTRARGTSTSASVTSGSTTWYETAFFTAPTTGSYTVSRNNDSTSSFSTPERLAIGPPYEQALGPVLGLFVVALLGGGALFMLGVTLLIVGLVKRSKAKRPPMPQVGFGGPPVSR